MRSVIVMLLSVIKRLLSVFSRKSELVDTPEPIGPGEVVCYYGCPNSNKAKKLQLNKTYR